MQIEQQIAVRRRVVRPCGDCAPVGFDGLTRPALLDEHLSEIVVTFSIVWLKPVRGLERGNGLLGVADGRQRDSEIAVRSGVLRCQGDGPLNQCHRRVVPSALMSDEPEHVERRSVARIHDQDLPVESFSFHQSPGLMVLHGTGKCFQ